jgi:hypothetical protein
VNERENLNVSGEQLWRPLAGGTIVVYGFDWVQVYRFTSGGSVLQDSKALLDDEMGPNAFGIQQTYNPLELENKPVAGFVG